jgi:hypothetical protein
MISDLENDEFRMTSGEMGSIGRRFIVRNSLAEEAGSSRDELLLAWRTFAPADSGHVSSPNVEESPDEDMDDGESAAFDLAFAALD